MSVSLYDLLDVEEDATAAEIRTAWKAAIADLDPSDRRFRAYNDAASVLLDPEKRAAYDAELAAGRAADSEEEPAPAAVSLDKGEPAPAEEPPAEAGDVAAPRPTSPMPAGPPTWALLAAAFVAVMAIALMVVVLTWPGSLGDDAPADKEEHAVEAEEAGAQAVDAAATAVPAVLSYDYRTLDQDFAEAEQYLTDDFAAKRTELFQQQSDSGITLREQVVEDKVVVSAALAGSGLTRVSDDGEAATVVVYVNQDSQKGKDAPRSLKMWATLSMVAVDGDWLIDDICTESDCG